MGNVTLLDGNVTLEDKVCHLEGDSMHSMTTNDERFYDKYDKFRPD